MADGPDNPLRVDKQVKIVWRITGSGELRLTSIGPDGGMHRLEWGPDAHLSGTYRRPGQEWEPAICSPSRAAGTCTRFVATRPPTSS